MLAVKEWAKDKPLLIALFAPQILPSVIDLHLDFKKIKSRRYGKQKFHLKHLPPWFALYRSHRKSITHLKAIYAAIFGQEFISVLDTLQKELRALKNANKETLAAKLLSPQKLKELIPALQQASKELLDASFDALEEEFNNAPLDHDISTAMNKLVEDTPLDSAFFLFVTFPCWLLYRTS